MATRSVSVLDDLNPEQRKAAEHVEGPVLIFAGAGSGKTRALTYRIAYMVRECGIPPESILAVIAENNRLRGRCVGDVEFGSPQLGALCAGLSRWRRRRDRRCLRLAGILSSGRPRGVGGCRRDRLDRRRRVEYRLHLEPHDKDAQAEDRRKQGAFCLGIHAEKSKRQKVTTLRSPLVVYLPS